MADKYEKNYYSDDIAKVLMYLADIGWGGDNYDLYKQVEESVWRIIAFAENGHNPELEALARVLDKVTDKYIDNLKW